MKRWVQSVLRAGLGLELRRVPASGGPRLDMAAHLRHVVSLGFAPATVIDVGAAEGTRPLLEAFPDAFHVLIEPLAEFEPPLRQVLTQVRGVFRIAAANEDGSAVALNVHPDHLHGSSLLKEAMGESADGRLRTVPGLRLDDLLDELGLAGPVLLKVDVQGAELMVLRGANRVLEKTELVLLEVSFFEFMKGSPDIAEVIRTMAAAGLVPFDIFGLSYRPLDGALGQVDIAFVRTGGRFRQDHRWDRSG